MKRTEFRSTPALRHTGFFLFWIAGISAYFFIAPEWKYYKILIDWLRASNALAPSLPALIGHLERVVKLLLISAAILGVGLRVLRAFVLPPNIFERLFLGFGLGYGCWGTILLLAGLAGWWKREFMLSTLAIGAILGGIEIYKLFRAQPAGAGGPSYSWTGIACIALTCIVGISLGRFSFIPETFYDALQYHLALPNIYALSHAIIPTPENSYSGIPALPQMLYGWSLFLDSWGIVAALLHTSLAAWLGIGIVAFCIRLGRPSAAPLALAGFFFAPVVLSEYFSVSVGFEWSLLQLCSITCAIAAISLPPDDSSRRKLLVLSGVFLGFTLSTKYPAWLLPLAYLSLLIGWGKNETQNSADINPMIARELLPIFLPALLILAPWIIKNIWFYGNPIFPFLHSYFQPGGHAAHWEKIIVAGGGNSASLRSMSGIFSYLLLPIKFLVPAESVLSSVGVFSICLLPLFAWIKLSRIERVLAIFLLIAWIPLAFFSWNPRFFIAHLLLLSILAATIAVRAQEVSASFRRGIAYAVYATLATGIFWMILFTGDSNREKLDTFLGVRSYSEFLGHRCSAYPAPPYAGIDFLNQRTMDPGSKVIFLGDPRSFYLRHLPLAASDDQTSVLETWANESASVQELRAKVADARVMYVLINLGELMRRREAIHTTPAGAAVLAKFWRKYAQNEFSVRNDSDRWVSVYKILTEAEAAHPRIADGLFDRFTNE